jgi:hypothetical protein
LSFNTALRRLRGNWKYVHMSPSVIRPQFSTSGARLNSRRLRRALSLSILASSSGMFWLFSDFGMVGMTGKERDDSMSKLRLEYVGAIGHGSHMGGTARVGLHGFKSGAHQGNFHE